MYIKDDAFASYKLLRSKFKTIGYSVTEEVVNNRRAVIFTSPSGRQWRTNVARLSYPFNSSKIRNISINKEVAYAFAQKSGLSIPYTYHLSDHYEMTSHDIDGLFKSYKKLIVKPADASLSRGLTLDVRSAGALRAAIVRARAVSTTVLIQEQVEGEEVRFVVIDGKVVSALLRRTPRVVGDGISTIAELISQENNERLALNLAYVTYPSLNNVVIDQSLLTQGEVLARGETMELSRATMIRNGASVYDVFDQVHTSYITCIEKLVLQLDAKFIVVDLFLEDFTRPKNKHNYWFIEFNTSPVLKLCYGCRDGKMFDVVPILVKMIDDWLHSSIIEID